MSWLLAIAVGILGPLVTASYILIGHIVIKHARSVRRLQAETRKIAELRAEGDRLWQEDEARQPIVIADGLCTSAEIDELRAHFAMPAHEESSRS